MDSKISKGSHLLLALLYAGERDRARQQRSTSVVGITRLEKLLFLLKHAGGFLTNAPARQGLDFIPFHLGPWSSEVYDELDFLDLLGLLQRKRSRERSVEDAAHYDHLFSGSVLEKYDISNVPADDKAEEYSLTDRGKHKAKEIWDALSEDEKNCIVSIKRKFNNMRLKQLLSYVYRKYPQFAAESQIKDFLELP